MGDKINLKRKQDERLENVVASTALGDDDSNDLRHVLVGCYPRSRRLRFVRYVMAIRDF